MAETVTFSLYRRVQALTIYSGSRRITNKALKQYLCLATLFFYLAAECYSPVHKRYGLGLRAML